MAVEVPFVDSGTNTMQFTMQSQFKFKRSILYCRTMAQLKIALRIPDYRCRMYRRFPVYLNAFKLIDGQK